MIIIITIIITKIITIIIRIKIKKYLWQFCLTTSFDILMVKLILVNCMVMDHVILFKNSSKSKMCKLIYNFAFID